jgi:hypothetical protein
MKLGARALGVCLSFSIVFALCLSTPFAMQAGTATGFPDGNAGYGNLPLSFERNDGQSDAHVKFFSRGSGYSIFLASDEAVLVLAPPQAATGRVVSGTRPARAQRNRTVPSAQTGAAAVLHLHLTGEKFNPSARVSGLVQLPGRSNYFRGNDPQHWITNIPSFQQVRYRSVYPGVDLVYYGNQHQLEYDMIVAPQSDPGTIRFAVEGASSMELSAGGDLVLHTVNGDAMLHKPMLYQAPASAPAGHASSASGAPASLQRETVEGSYVLRGNEIQFHVGVYDPSRPLVIDPVLSYSTFLGGSGLDQGSAIAVDTSGNAYIAGATTSPDFPTTNSIMPFNQGEMVFITKLNSAGNTIVYSTYLGGGGFQEFDFPSGVAIDTGGNVYVTGTTSDVDFPVTSNAYLNTFPGTTSAFISKLNPSGNGLLYSTYLGATDGDVFQSQAPGSNIAADANGNAYVSGNTSADNFPTTGNAYLAAKPGGAQNASDVPFVSKINTTASGASSLVYSTYFGGTGSTGSDIVGAIAANVSGKVYITGTAASTDFPITAATAFQPTLHANAVSDAFVSVLDTTQSGSASLTYSSFLGGTGADTGLGIAVDGTGKIDVTGRAVSTDFPVKNAFQATPNFTTCGSNAFISQFDITKTPGSATLAYSTYLGGSDPFSCSEQANAIAVDSSGKVYLTGQTDSPDFPIKNPLQAMPGFSLEAAQAAVANDAGAQVNNVFVSQLDPSQSGTASLLFSTYLGGNDATGDIGYGVAADSTGANIYITGLAHSFNFPTANPLQPYGGGQDGFATKITLAGTSPAIQLTPDFLPFDTPQPVNTSTTQPIILKNVGNAAMTVSGISLTSAAFSQTNTCGTLPATIAIGATCTITVTFKPLVPGNWSATLIITNSSLGSPHRVILTGVGQTTSTVTLASSLNPSTYGQDLSFTATVTPGAAGGVPPTGTISFMDGANVINQANVVAGVASFKADLADDTLLDAGSHSLTAVYSGDTLRVGSTSSILTQVVNQAATTTTVVSSLNPSAFGAGNPPTFTATVAAVNGLTTPLGTVAFKDGATLLGTSSISAGQAVFTPASNTVLAIGTHPITALYQGDAVEWSASTSSVLNQVVKSASTTSLAAQINGAPFGGTAFFTRNPAQKLILTVTVTGNAGSAPAGTVTFMDGATTLGPANLATVNSTTATATFQLTGLPNGLHQISATFPNTGPYAGSTSNVVMVYQSPRPKIH